METSKLKDLILTFFVAVLIITSASAQIENTPLGVTSEVLKTLKVSDIVIPEGNKPIECRGLRLRRLDVVPGGKIPVHSHENRPAILSIVSGEGMDVSSYSMEDEDEEKLVTVPYATSYAEFNGIVHYAVNLSSSDTLKLITFDFLDNGSLCNGNKYAEKLELFDKLKTEENPFYINNSTHVEGAEVSTSIFYVPLSDINFPEGSTTLNERTLRTRKIKIKSGNSLPEQNYLNRPTYIYVLEGALEIQKNKFVKEIIQSGGASKLINHGNATIHNTSTTQKVIYITMELWDPTEEDVL